MNNQFIFEAYQKLPKKGQIVFLDTLEFLCEYIRVMPKFTGTITGSNVEGTNIVIFTYKNPSACGSKVRAIFDVNNPLELSSITMMKIGIMEMLEKGNVVQKLKLDEKSEKFFKNALGLDDESLDYFYTKDNSTGKYIFNTNAIKREGENIIFDGKIKLYDELDDETKKALSFYDKLVSSFGHTELTNIGNLDESYFQWDLYLMSGYNISALHKMLQDDEGKNLIENIQFEKGSLLINGKIYHLELRKGGEKARDFFKLLCCYFSQNDAHEVRLVDLVTFAEDEKIKFQKLTTKDVANSKQVNSYLETFYDNIGKTYGGKPRIFLKKSTVITLEKAKNIQNSPSIEAR